MVKMFDMDIFGFKDKVFIKRMLRLALPIMFQQLILTAMYMVDTVMIGGLGDAPLAGVGAANQLAYLLDIALFGVMSGGGVYMSQFFGKEDKKGFRSTLGLSVTLCTAFSVLFVVIGFCFAPDIVSIFAEDGASEVIDSGADYLRIACFGYIFKALIYPYGTAKKSEGDARTPMISSCTGLVVNMFLNYCMILGDLGFPALGVRGAAYATLVGSLIDAALLLTLSYRRESFVRAKLSEMLDFSNIRISRFVNISLPAFLNDALWAVGTITITYIYGRMGTDAFAAMMIVGTVDKLVMVAFMGVGMACAVMLGNSIGEGDTERAVLYGRRCMCLSTLAGVLLGVLCCMFGVLIPGLYTDTSEQVRTLAKQTIFYMGFVLPFYGINFTSVVGVLRSGGDTRAAAIIDVLPLIAVAIPLCALGGLVLKQPLPIVFVMMFPSNILRSILALIRIKSGRWVRRLV